MPSSSPGPAADSAGADREAIPRKIRGHIEAYGQGRTCAEPGCDTALSRYNKAARCWTHAQAAQRSSS